MSRHVLRPDARRDLRSIWRYSVEHWGRERADRYVRDIHQAFAALADEVHRGRRCDDILPEYRKYRVESHMIFYRVIADGIEIVRILHQNMDFVRHLRDRDTEGR